MTSENNAPVLVTRGLKQRILSQKVHWLEVTFKGENATVLPSILSGKFSDTRAFHGYTIGKLSEHGHQVWKNPERPDMGTHVVWTGDACDDSPTPLVNLIGQLLDSGARFTRIDLAIDAINFNLRPSRATKELNLGRVKTRAKKSLRTDDARNPGYTQYIGQKTATIFLKLYDKAAEMGVDGDHARIELTVRSARANHAAREIVRGTDFRSMVVSFVDFPEWRQWRQIMEVDPVKLPKEQKLGNTERWLLDQCAPALARVIYFAGNTTFYETFKANVMRNLEQLSKDGQTLQ